MGALANTGYTKSFGERVNSKANDTSGINLNNPYLSPADEDTGGKEWGAAIDSLTPIAPDIDPRYKALQDQQSALARQFQGREKQYEDSLFAPQRQAAFQQNADNIKNVRQNANSTGNLYSGYEQGAEGALPSNLAANLSNIRANINQQVTQAGQGLLSGAVGTGFGMAGMNTGQAGFNQAAQGQSQVAQAQAAALNNMQIGQFGGGLGKIAGVGLGNVFGRSAGGANTAESIANNYGPIPSLTTPDLNAYGGGY